MLRMILVNLTTLPRADRATLPSSRWDGVHLTLILGFLPYSPPDQSALDDGQGRMVAHGGRDQSRYNRAAATLIIYRDLAFN